jgi:hypothetical protein
LKERPLGLAGETRRSSPSYLTEAAVGQIDLDPEPSDEWRRQIARRNRRR